MGVIKKKNEQWFVAFLTFHRGPVGCRFEKQVQKNGREVEDMKGKEGERK